jgi:hypothetical protein
MQPRETIAWCLLAVVGVAIWMYWPTVKAAWKYREQLQHANSVLDGLTQAGVL